MNESNSPTTPVIHSAGPIETVDVVIVGARCAGTAAAVPLARAGRSVVVLDKTRFPADTMSTHVLVPNGVQELQQMGALRKILALGPAKSRYLTLNDGDLEIRERFTPFAGIDYGLCIPRDQQDLLLVEAARDAGADVRERCSVEQVVWRDGRAVGVRYRTSDGEFEIHAKLVIGADGRKSRIAAEVDSWTPYRASKNGRGFAFRYEYYISGVDEAEALIVVARTAPEKLSLFLVPTDAPGLVRHRLPVGISVPEKQFTLHFDDVRVPASNLIGTEHEGFRQVFDGLNPERITGAAVCVGVGRHAVEKAADYARTRTVWGPSIGSYQLISHPLAKAKIEVDLAAMMTAKAAWLYDNGQEAGEASFRPSYAHPPGIANVDATQSVLSTIFKLRNTIHSHSLRAVGALKEPAPYAGKDHGRVQLLIPHDVYSEIDVSQRARWGFEEVAPGTALPAAADLATVATSAVDAVFSFLDQLGWMTSFEGIQEKDDVLKLDELTVLKDERKMAAMIRRMVGFTSTESEALGVPYTAE